MIDRFVTARVLAVLLLLGAPVSSPASTPPAQSPPAKFSTDRLDQIVAPVALYPDALLMQVLIASTYPLEVVEADRWLRQSKLKGDALDKALEQKDWDPSIKGLTHFPNVLERMSDNLDWTTDMGDAFLAQKGDVLSAVQGMRKRAHDAGSLKTSKEQIVKTESVNSKETIIIQPADPQVVYVPTYAPGAVYGSYAPPAPFYPAVYGGYSPGQLATASLLSFGAGVGVGALISNGCDWGHGNVYVNNNYGGWGGGWYGNGYNNGYGYNNGHNGYSNGHNNGHNNVNVNNTINQANVAANQQTWQHNPEHRRNVAYRDPETAQRYGGQTPTAQARQRENLARGYDHDAVGQNVRPTNRPWAGGSGARAPGNRGGSMASRGLGSGASGERLPRASIGGGEGAFGGYGNGRATQQASARGAASRNGMSWAGGGGGRGALFGGGGGRGLGGHGGRLGRLL